MNSTGINLDVYLDTLKEIYKPSEVILVGANVPSWLTIVQKFSVDDVYYINPDKQQTNKLKSIYNLPENWHIHNALLYKESTKIPYYKLSNPSLNGSVSGEVLSQLWKNLKTTQVVEKEGIKLDELLETNEKLKWLIVDCFGALEILEGSKKLLDNIEVIVCRAVRDENINLVDLSKQTLDMWMSEYGYKNIAVFEENHPSVVLSLYVRDYKKMLWTTQEKLNNSTSKTEELHSQLETTKQESEKVQEHAKQTTIKEIKNIKETLAEKQKQNETLKIQLESIKQESGKALEILKATNTKEKETLNAALAEKQKLSETLKTELEFTKEESTKALEILTQTNAKEIEIRNTTLQDELKEKETLSTQLDTTKQQSQKVLETEKQAKVKELETLNRTLTEKQKQNETLKTQLESNKQELSKILEQEKYSDDANIEYFIQDIIPFFSDKAITYVDIGAFIGEVFLKLNNVSDLKIREAHLFEPNPESYAKLQNNVENINLSSLHLHNIGLGEKKDKRLFSAAKSMSKIIDAKIDLTNDTDYFESKISALNEFYNIITDNHIDLLKIDVEGFEVNVLNGSAKFLENELVDIIYIEVGFNKNSIQQTYFVEIDEFLQKYNYRVFKIYEQKNEWISDSPLLRRCNFAYMSSSFSKNNPYKKTIENIKLKKIIKKLNEE